MDSSPALYMCFRCYQLFDSLDDVLFHQYNLHPNDVGGEDCLASAPGPQTESEEVFQCVPCWMLFQSQEELTQHRGSSGCSQHQPAPQPPPSTSAPDRQDPPHAGPSPVTERDRANAPPAPSLLSQEQNRGQIQFQCADCGCLFEALAPWLQHRKLNECSRTAPELNWAAPEPNSTAPEPNSTAPKPNSTAPEPNSEIPEEGEGAELGMREAPPPDGQATEPTDPQSAQEGEGEGEGDGGDRPQRAAGRRKKSAAAALTSCRSFLCGECGAGFNWQPALVAHRRTEHGLEGALHRCLECGESFMNSALFVQHCKKHRDWLARRPRVKRRRSQQRAENGGQEKEIIRKRPTKRKPKAGAPSSSLDPGSEPSPDRRAPLRRPRRGRCAPQECPQCRRTFSNPRYLRAHVLSHAGQKQFHCEECGKAFTYQNNLRRHRLLHTGDRPYMCDRCGRTFTQSSHLKDHLRQHDRARGWDRPRGRGAREQEWADVGPKLPHPCPDCPRSFMTQTQLLMHRKMCPICERSFKWRGSLPAHIVRHTDNKLFGCDVCGKTFSYQTNLARHLIIHAGTRPYSCRQCGKTFNQSSNLRQHLLVHAKAGTLRLAPHREQEPGAQPLHPCPDCPASFHSFSQLQEHRLTHPAQDSFPCSGCGLEACHCQQHDDQLPASHQDAECLSCPRCSAPFHSQEALEEHGGSCAGGRGRRGRRSRSARQSECLLCGRCCGSPQELELHQLSHVGQPQLQCPLPPCPRCFTTSHALQNHLFSHFPGPTCQNLRPEGLLDPTAPQPEEETEVETTVAVLPLWEVFPADPAHAGP